MDTPSLPMFESIAAECQYWKQRSQLYLEELMAVKKEFDEFVEQSRDIEVEMDASLEQKRKKVGELTTKATIYEREKEVLMGRLNTQSTEMSSMANELEAVTEKFEAMKKDLRALEQSNDDLEQAQRVASESKEIAENLLFEQYEKNAMLEVEVEEKHVLEEELQRLKDETRDLRQELKTLRDLKLGCVTVASQIGGGDSLDSPNTEPLKADFGQFTVATLNPEKDLKPAGRVTVASQCDDSDSLDNLKSLEQFNTDSMGSNQQFLIHKTVADMVIKLNNLQTKLRAHREKRPLPSTSYC